MILDEVRQVVQDRQGKYGHPAINHGCTARLWNAYITRRFINKPVDLTTRDVCILNILQKISRDANEPHWDNLVDIIGFAENAARIEPKVSDPQPAPDWDTLREEKTVGTNLS